MWIGDCETDGLYEECTKIHCAVFYNTDTEEYIEFTPKNISEMPKWLDSNVKQLCMHNGIGFDLKVFKKLFNYEYKGYFIDSLLMCQVLFPDIEKNKGGKHSVESWGMRFEIEKPEHEDWSRFSEEMLHRCKEDVKIQTRIYLKCINEINNYKSKDSRLNNWKEIFKLEMDFWKGMETQAENGWLLDIDKTYKYYIQLEKDMSQIDNQLKDILPKVLKKPYGDKECTAFKQNGELSENAKKWTANWKLQEHCIIYRKQHPELTCWSGEVLGDFCRIAFEPLNLNSPGQLKDYLLSQGWIPTKYNFKKDKHNKPIRDEKGNYIFTTPKIPNTPEEWEELAIQLDTPEIKLLTTRSKIKHRYGMLKGFYDKVRSDGRIASKMITCGTPTARATHIDVVNVPKAEEGVFMGSECRSIFTVPEGKILVGADASALEARCEAHYLYKIDKEAAKFLIDCDIHEYNASIWDVIRRLAKNGKYALTYGCSPKKLAATLLKPEDMAKQLYEDFWNANPALKELVRLLEVQLQSKGYLVAIDGRPLTIRYNHARLNTLLQSAGAIAMKKAWCIFDEWRTKEGLQKEVLDVGNFHDELQIETVPELGEIIGKEIVKSIQKAGEMLKFNVELNGEYKIGQNWSMTH